MAATTPTGSEVRTIQRAGRRIKVDWPKYNQRRRSEGTNRKERFACLADEARRLLGNAGSVRPARV